MASIAKHSASLLRGPFAVYIVVIGISFVAGLFYATMPILMSNLCAKVLEPGQPTDDPHFRTTNIPGVSLYVGPHVDMAN